MAELQELILDDFTGGLNLRRTQVTLQRNESPDMLNVEIDPRGGFFTRRGWHRFNVLDADTPATWSPRRGHQHQLTNGDVLVFVANASSIFEFDNTVATDHAITADASPHGADFASWGNTVYMACGYQRLAYKQVGTGAPASIPDSHLGYNSDYTVPVGGRFPNCELVETHAGYMFAAYIDESGTVQRNRLRWSHPDQPEDWASVDFLDIEAGGSHITALRSFRDHLLIFKTDSLWALYGYNSESWQLVQVSRNAGAPSPSAVTASESAVFYYSVANKGAIFAYSGGDVVDIGEKVRTVMEETVPHADDVFIGWAGRRLWCSVPWIQGEVRTGNKSTVFVFDPEVGGGSWVKHRATDGDLMCIIEGDLLTYPIAGVSGESGVAVLALLDYYEAASDYLEYATGARVAVPFSTLYSTAWQFPEGSRRKSWRRPKFIAKNESQTYGIDVNSYWDFNEASAVRSHTFSVEVDGSTFWRLTGALETDGFDWGDGSLWGASMAEGSTIVRAQQAVEGRTGLGVNRSLQLRFSTSAAYAGRPWGISAVMLKYIARKLTT